MTFLTGVMSLNFLMCAEGELPIEMETAFAFLNFAMLCL